MIDLNSPFNLEIIQNLPWKTAPLAKLNTLTKKDVLKAEMDHAGIYVFWWAGELDILKSLHLNIKIQGKVKDSKVSEADLRYHHHDITFDPNWLTPIKLKSETGTFYSLYVGKSTNVLNRLGLHLRNNSNHEDWRKTILKSKIYYPTQFYSLNNPTTSCQFRSGMELLCLGIEKEEAYWRIVNKNIYFSYLTLDDVDKGKFVPHRFYLEDYLIGALRPWFNLDSER